MPAWMEWIKQHGFAIAIVVLAAAAIAYVVAKRKSLFYKE